MSADATITVERLKAALFHGPVLYGDNQRGGAVQEFASDVSPRFRYAWRSENPKDEGRVYYLVDGEEVPDLDEAARRLNLPPDPNSREERMRAWSED